MHIMQQDRIANFSGIGGAPQLAGIEFAQRMGVTRHTVQTFVRRIYAKLQVNTRAEAIHAAYKQGLLAD